MKWKGELAFGSGWAAFRGSAADNSLHAHVAIQLVFAENGEVTLITGAGEVRTGSCMVIMPLVEHRLSNASMVTLLYAEPQTPVALVATKLAGGADVTEIDGAAFEFTPGLPLVDWGVRLEAMQSRLRLDLDKRLRQALSLLAAADDNQTIRETARRCGLSASRLRVLAHRQLGVPLATWLIWRKLERAARALDGGAALADAAAAGGFADQAHFSRVLKRMFGITPQVARNARL